MRAAKVFVVLVLGYSAVVAAHAVNTGEQPDFLKRLHGEKDWNPMVLVDVGANRGGWSQNARNLWPDASIFMIEADHKHESQLADMKDKIGNAEYHIGLMAESEKKVDFFDDHRNSGSTGNSMFREKTAFYAHAVAKKITTATVDSAVKASFLGDRPVDLLKIDVQGAEHLVLLGAERVLSEVTFVQLEASIIEYNEGGSCFWEVDALLRSRGFAMYDISDVARNPMLFKSSGAGQYDALYVRAASKKLPAILRNAEFCVKPSAFSLAIKASSTASASSLDGHDTESAVDILKAENARLMEKVKELTTIIEGRGGRKLRRNLSSH